MSPTPWRVGPGKATHVVRLIDADGHVLGWLYAGDEYQGNVEAVLRAVNAPKESTCESASREPARE